VKRNPNLRMEELKKVKRNPSQKTVAKRQKSRKSSRNNSNSNSNNRVRSPAAVTKSLQKNLSQHPSLPRLKMMMERKNQQRQNKRIPLISSLLPLLFYTISRL
jgi:ERCC4-related helicase